MHYVRVKINLMLCCHIGSQVSQVVSGFDHRSDNQSLFHSHGN